MPSATQHSPKAAPPPAQSTCTGPVKGILEQAEALGLCTFLHNKYMNFNWSAREWIIPWHEFPDHGDYLRFEWSSDNRLQFNLGYVYLRSSNSSTSPS